MDHRMFAILKSVRMPLARLLRYMLVLNGWRSIILQSAGQRCNTYLLLNSSVIMLLLLFLLSPLAFLKYSNVSFRLIYLLWYIIVSVFQRSKNRTREKQINRQDIQKQRLGLSLVFTLNNINRQ